MKVKRRMIPVYVAYDGREFDTAEECVKYETRTNLSVRCALDEIGRSRQLCKNECRSAERHIAFWRRKALGLLRNWKMSKGRAVAEDLGKAFVALATALGKRDEHRAKLRNLHERQGQLRSLLDKNKGKRQ